MHFEYGTFNKPLSFETGVNRFLKNDKTWSIFKLYLIELIKWVLWSSIWCIHRIESHPTQESINIYPFISYVLRSFGNKRKAHIFHLSQIHSTLQIKRRKYIQALLGVCLMIYSSYSIPDNTWAKWWKFLYFSNSMRSGTVTRIKIKFLDIVFLYTCDSGNVKQHLWWNNRMHLIYAQSAHKLRINVSSCTMTTSHCLNLRYLWKYIRSFAFFFNSWIMSNSCAVRYHIFSII